MTATSNTAEHNPSAAENRHAAVARGREMRGFAWSARAARPEVCAATAGPPCARSLPRGAWTASGAIEVATHRRRSSAAWAKRVGSPPGVCDG